MPTWTTALACALLVIGCTSDRVELIVDLRSDLLPGSEFVTVKTTLISEGMPQGQSELAIEETNDILAGIRIAEFAGLKKGPYRLLIELVDGAGEIVVERPVDLLLRESFAVTVLITRDCRNIDCDRPELPACLSGQCVDAHCTRETPEYCPEPECVVRDDETNGSDCPNMPGCGTPICSGGICLEQPESVEPEVCDDMDNDCDDRIDECDSGYSCRDGACKSPPALYAAHATTSATNSETFRAVTMDGSGDALLTGEFIDGTGIGSSTTAGSGLMVARFTTSGTLEEVKAIPTTGASIVDLEVDAANNIYIAGTIDRSALFDPMPGADVSTVGGGGFIASYMPDGILRRVIPIDSPNADTVEALTFTNGQVIAVGRMGGPAVLTNPCSPLPEGPHILIAAFNAETGNCEWATAFEEGEGGPLRATSLEPTVDGLLVAGSFEGTVDFGSGLRATAGGRDAFVVKLGDLGTHLWDRTFGGPETDEIIDLASGPGGEIVALGTYEGTVDLGGGPRTSAGDHDLFVLKLQGSGAYRWDRTFGGTTADDAISVSVDAHGTALITGNTPSGTIPLVGEPETGAFLMALHPDGGYAWHISHPAGLTPKTAIVSGTEHYLVAGCFQQSVDFGTGVETVPWDSASDAFVLRLDY